MSAPVNQNPSFFESVKRFPKKVGNAVAHGYNRFYVRHIDKAVDTILPNKPFGSTLKKILHVAPFALAFVAITFLAPPIVSTLLTFGCVVITLLMISSKSKHATSLINTIGLKDFVIGTASLVSACFAVHPLGPIVYSVVTTVQGIMFMWLADQYDRNRENLDAIRGNNRQPSH